jgi:hypothetical protein
MKSWEMVMYPGLTLFIANAVRILWHQQKEQKDFIAWMENKHPEEFRKMFYEDGVRKFFMPWGKDTPSYFMGFSSENFGDETITEFRMRLRWLRYSFTVNAVAALVFFVVVAVSF